MLTSSVRRSIAFSGATLAAVTIIYVLSQLFYRSFERQSVRVIEGAIPPTFPVVILFAQPDATRVARALYFSDVPWDRVGRDLSVSIPPDALSLINASLCQQTRSRECNDPHHPLAYTATVEVLSVSGRSQVVRSELNWERDRKNVGWYEVTNNAVRPLRYQNFEWLRAFRLALLFASLVGLGMAGAGLFATRRWWDPRFLASAVAT
jgi:hypothetical protein